MRIDREFMERTLQQFALDYNVEGGEWITEKIHLSPVKILEGARLHVKQDTFFKAAVIMGKAYVMADEVLHPWIKEHMTKTAPEWWCLFSNLRELDEKLKEYGREILDTHIYFLPSEAEPSRSWKGDGAHSQSSLHGREEAAAAVDEKWKVKWLEGEALEQFREDQRFNTYALSFSPTQPDRLAVAACDGENMIGMAGCSEDGAYLWQIGIDTVPGCEGRGLAVKLVSLLKKEIIARGKVPYYGTSESHGVSRTVAVKSGFLPAWCEIQTRLAKVPL